nr:MAG TPA: hypothetical protein [Caudoviricetes sp.]
MIFVEKELQNQKFSLSLWYQMIAEMGTWWLYKGNIRNISFAAIPVILSLECM